MTNPIERVAVTLEDGGMLYLCNLREEFKKKAVIDKIEKTGRYVHKENNAKYYIPRLTTELIASNSRGILLSTVLCPHCKGNVIMTIKCIINEDITTCCNCRRDLFIGKSKKTKTGRR